MQTKQDEKLHEVRAILQGLQRISTSTQDNDAADRADPSVAPEASASEPRQQASPAPRRARAASMAILAAAGLVLVAGAAAMLWLNRERPAAPVEAKPPVEVKAPAGPVTSAAITEPAPAENSTPPVSPGLARDAMRLAQARALMDRGEVAEARQLLLADPGGAKRRCRAAARALL